MTDIFEEVSAELRRDRMSEAWDKYGRYIIALAVAIIVLTTAVIGYSSYRASQDQAASLRYDALLESLQDADSEARLAALKSFAAAEDNGYGVLADFSYAYALFEAGDAAGALSAFDALSEKGGVPDSLQDYAKLQASIVLLNSDGALGDIETRLDDLLEEGNGLLPVARETMALAYMRDDQPLEARRLFQALLSDANSSSLTRERALIMLQKLSLALLPEAVGDDDAADEAGADKGKTE